MKQNTQKIPIHDDHPNMVLLDAPKAQPPVDDAGLPSPGELAAIAAHLYRDVGDAGAAVDHAWDLWLAANTKVTKIRAQEESVEKTHQQILKRCKPIPDGVSFPASLNDFLRRVVRAKTSADAEKRFRDFLYHRYERFFSQNANVDVKAAATKEKGSYRQHGIEDAEEWQLLAEAYERWWKPRLSATNHRNAKARFTVKNAR